ncbi:unnamed protein product [Oikopleura dioica]|uniref:SH3 domain-containing protein n=1 Tax=Oikopleura dioica TaxID=34765 RepID=E4XQW6_OIKDI|nr:unnamed protein product [Oikopleura dioica]
MFAEMTLAELNALADRQRRQIEEQEKTLTAKQQRLSFLTQQSQQQSKDADHLRKLREKVGEQEERLRMLRVGPEQNTALLSAELDSVRNLLEAKQRELNVSMNKVEQLTSVLGDLRKTTTSTNGAEEVNKLNKELNALHNLNNDQSNRLQAQRELLRKKQEESQDLDMKILELADRINKKRAAQNGKGAQSQQKYTNVAAVEPLVNSAAQNRNLKTDGPVQKGQVLNNITSRTEIAPDDAESRKKRGQRPISEILTRQDAKSKSSSLAPGSSLFQYRNPTEEKPRPPPPSYTEALSRRSLPGQASRGKLGIKKPVSPGGDKNVFDEWRKRYANTPRPLKKRSSFSEAEGNNYYQQLYKTSDPLFRDPRNIPLEEEAEQSSQSSESENPKPATSNQEVNKSSPSRGKAKEEGAPPTPPQRAPDEKYTTRSPPQLKSAIKKTRGILKKQGAPRNSSRRVELDPLALLLDASLAGEIDVVRSVIAKVSNPSYANDEGITALHNAVCAGYFDVVKFLVHSGVDINAADSDGWTPLHCAASCNSLQMVKFLCENGAQIFAETYPDNDTAAEKCEELDEGYVNCTEYLYGTQEKLGIVNKASVYALFDYDAESSDELSFKEGDLLYVKRRGDNDEDKWWWSRHSDTGREGYVPRNYLGMWPRIKPPNKK